MYFSSYMVELDETSIKFLENGRRILVIIYYLVKLSIATRVNIIL